MTCSAPPDCAEIERRRATGIGLLIDGGASRGNLLSGEAEDVILTVSRMEAEKKSNPGYRAFLANGDNVTRTLVLFGWEVILEWTAALRAIRRDVRPRGHRGGIYPLMRGALCVFVRDLIVSGVLTDMMRGRPAVYATFSSYDEVAHHSGLERADTLEALRKLDDHFAQIERARRYAPRPYEIVVLSDHGQTQGATFKQRNGYGLDELVERSLAQGDVAGNRRRGRAELDGRPRLQRGDREEGEAAQERRLRPGRRRARLRQPRPRLPDGGAPPADARGDRRAAPGAPARPPLRIPTSAGCSSARPSTGRSRSAPAAPTTSRTAASRARIRSRRSRPRTAAPAAHRRLPARRRHHGRQLLRPRARRGLRLRGADLASTAASAASRRARSSSTRRTSRYPPGRSSAPRACTASSRAGGSSSSPARTRGPSAHRPDGRPAQPGNRSGTRGSGAPWNASAVSPTGLARDLSLGSVGGFV